MLVFPRSKNYTISLLLLRIYKLFLFVHFCVVSKFQKDTRVNVSIPSQNYAECIQTKYDHRRDSNVKEMSIFDFHVDSTSKLHQISIS